MANVYLAEDLKHHRRVAVKVLRPELAASLGAERFLREIQTTANLRHPHILPLYDSGDVADPDDASGRRFLYYVMPLVEGETLRDRITRERQLPIDDALRIACEVSDALSYAHARGIIHRDIKPENIFIESGHAVVSDFGIARAIRSAGGESLTGTGLSVGTPAYMSPEQISGDQDLDGRSDLYSLGCVLYEMLGGQPPFTGPTVESIARQHLIAQPAPVTNLRPSVPAPVLSALDRALAKNPADRFNPVAQFADALRVGEPPAAPRGVRQSSTPSASASGQPVVAAAPSQSALVATPLVTSVRSQSWRRRVPAILAAIAVVVIGVVVASRGGWWRSNAGSDAPGLTSNSRQLPIVVMMDSPHPSRVYDEETIQLSGTNADVLNDLLRDLPIQRVKETAGPGWHRHEEIRRLDPDLVVMHLSAFCQEECEPNRVKLREFIEYLADTRTQFLIYSRMQPDSLTASFRAMLGDLPQRFPKLESRLHLFALIEHGTPHWKDPATAAALKLRVKQLLSLK